MLPARRSVSGSVPWRSPMPYLAMLFEQMLDSDEIPDVTHLLEDCDPDDDAEE